jgi:cellobiose PTS system EIIC component
VPASRFTRFGNTLAQSPHLCAVRDGIVAALPIILFSSLLLLLAAPPVPSLAALLAPWAPALSLGVKALNGGISIYVAFGCAQSLARRRGLDPVGPAVLAAAALLLAAALPAGGVAGSIASAGSLAGDRLNQTGLFAGLVLGLASAELVALFERLQLTIRMPAGVPEAIARSFATLVPGFALLTAVFVLRLLGVDFLGATQAIARPLVSIAGSFGGVLLVSLCDAGLYYLGVHPGGVIAAFQPLWLSMLAENQAARLAGHALPHIANREFFLWFVWQGGSGGTLALMLCLLLTRAKSLRALSKLALVPSIFNINEPLLFGLPIVLNPSLAVPFLLGPLVSASVAYLAFSLNFVSRPVYEVLWTLPAPVGAFLSCADPRAVVLELFTLGLGCAIWWPFVRRIDRRRLQAEQSAEQSELAQRC